ncbi:MAG TPA: sodium/glutamate symporter [Jeotgalicoccus sp.]|nr:sodium/glutamate symporter [Jeotgalicoccus sp.]HBV22723.1 sodium/glutamate symporter [Jeotgalicoccus sp.]
MELNLVTSLFLAVMVYLIGAYLVRKIHFLDRYSIPAPVVGGLLFAVFTLIMHSTGLVTITVETSLQSLFMIIFFTTVGLGASFKLIKLGGKLLVIYLLAASFLSVIQNTLGVSLAGLLGIDPLLGLMASSPAMIGGHGGAAAFGETIDGLGVQGATTVGIAAATLGLIAGGVFGGPVARFMINRHNLKSNEPDFNAAQYEFENPKEENKFTINQFFIYLLIITFAMALGTYIGGIFSDLTGVILPDYVGAMFVAIVVRTLLDASQDRVPFDFDTTVNDKIGAVSLGLFLSFALMSIKLWELADLALPILLIVSAHVIVIILYTMFIVYRLLGKNYDAVVMINGMIGSGLGATPTAMANMDAVTSKFGSSKTAYLIVPVVGAFLIDIVNIPVIVFFINLFS